MAKRDYYEVLGIDQGAGDSDIKRAYRRLAMEHHPDRNPDAEDAEERFKEATEAYQVLSDAKQRATYDRFGHDGLANSGFHASSFNGGFADIFGDLGGVFSDIFDTGGARRGARNAPVRGSDIRYKLTIDLEQAVAGDKVEFKIPILAPCNDCGGNGSARGAKPTVCPDCRGAGTVEYTQSFLLMRQTCPRCRGARQIILNPCPRCRGEGRIEKRSHLSVSIPPGVDEGDRIRLSGKGEAGISGGPSGDLYVVVNVRPHSVFARENANLRCDVPISMTQAALGGEVEIPTLDGKVMLKIPKETQSGTQLRIRGRGVKPVRANTRGDLLCRVMVETPVSLSEKQRGILEEFQRTLDEDTNKHSPQGTSWLANVRSFFDRLTDN